MPGPKEASTDSMNNYLKPLVDKLLELYNGVKMSDNSNENITVRAALMCVACDIPAARKTSGFTGHASICACHKCQRQFTMIPETTQVDFSGFEYSTWIKRTKARNLDYANKWKEAKNAAERTRLKRSNGTRWSQLHLLTYFDPVWCTIIDPMHNLFLGTAKRMVQIWKELEYFDNQALLAMQDLANGVVVPPDYTRINKKIADGFSFMKADEWKSWCLIYSPFVLKRILPVKHLSNWMFFVNACRLSQNPLLLLTTYPVPMPISNSSNLDTNQKGGFEVTMMKRFLEKAYVGNYIQSFEKKFPASTVNFLHSITRSQVILEQPSSMSSSFILSTFVEYSMNPRKSVMGCEPLPSDVLSFKVEPKIVMCKEHYELISNGTAVSIGLEFQF
ncbi:hypothetical protein PHYBLDRAFT_149559 [Phycomyces blakesleeanus NRRL 1555(-)]|uniref:Uncharacterized protein n=1 Tax=Phycomyces blakesleeanus (strain ATCC 8743b / DSM 1359 / FGSC 10004 / NBRC 33097 / NRRL 1555) TaxID=763407 RepID=A0A167KY57_PHYB8|nr:hypothetical protein PHYBLDRAFT_149559 [Phycomyces blakesleeanus NRRL 1555(-)]OAD69156.1 hypothetical protein PHYBLDRAFT_149559 [Phycomyces blakesleeanus NRRL 1555(-)]|eukprot:XP_018287196.1 hypothetical protein PHYBLDRAFT_149559 [Phycomyces blakesleeanus NRRL 1555(-)]